MSSDDYRIQSQALPAQRSVLPGNGQPMVAYQDVQPHSAGLAVAASFFVPGLGSMLNGRALKGIAILANHIVMVIFAFVTLGFLFILPFGVWIYGMVAGNNDAHKWNRKHGIIS